MALGFAAALDVVSARINDRPTQWYLFLGSQWLAAAGSIAAALLFWWTWHRLETKRSGDPILSR